jgi:hypothetical protein
MRLLVTIPINLNHTVWLLLPLFWTRLLVTVPIILDQAVGSSTLTNSLIQNDRNDDQQPDPK